MEDAHTAVLDLDGQAESSNAFFAVYDGHGGTFHLYLLLAKIFSKYCLGSTVARFAGMNVHKRLVAEESYQQGDYEIALKKAFLGTDEDLLASKPLCRFPFLTL